MKKILLFLFFALMSSFIYGQYIDESFEGGWPPTDWLVVNNGSGNDWIQNTTSSNSNTGSNSAMYGYNSSNAADTWLFTKAVTLANGETVNWEFYEKVASGTYPENLKFTVGTAQTVASQTTTLVDLPGLTNTSFVKQSGTYTAPAAGTYYFALNCYSDADQYNLFVDDVLIETPPACPAPTDQTATNITATSADLGWTTGGASAWEVVIQAPGTGTPTGSGTATTVNPYHATGLSSATDYEFYVRDFCDPDYSTWTGPFTFTTECTTMTLPWSEDFENAGTIPSCWSENGGESWKFSNSGSGNHLGNNGTMDGSSTSGGYFAWIDDSGDDAPSTLTSPFVDISSLTTPMLSFYEISNNEGDANATLSVEVWDGAAWNTVGTYNTNTAGGWEKRDIDISSLTYTGATRVRFTITDSGSYYDDIAIDDVTFVEVPSCPAPSAQTATNETLTGADLGWTENGSSTHWDLEIGATGFTPTGTPTENDVTTNPYTWSVGASGTSYDFYVRADCGADNTDVSAWIGPFTFTTLCEANSSYPFTEEFEGASFPPNCWSEERNPASSYGWGSNSGGYSGNCARFDSYLNSNGNKSKLLTQTLDLTSLSAAQLRFYYKNPTGGDFSVFISTDGGATYSTLASGLTGQSSWIEMIYDITAYIGNNVVIDFEGTSNYGSGDAYVYLDNVVVEAPPSCPAPSAQTATNITTTEADLDWTENGSATTWTFEYKADADFTPGNNEQDQTATVQVHPYGIAGLTAGTTYYWYVRADCGGADGSSIWTGPHMFTTAPPNDDCSGAIAVTVDAAGAGCPSPTTADNTSATGSEATNGTPSCNSYQGGDVWYSFTAPYGGKVKVVVSANNWSTAAAAIYDGCGSDTEIDCDGVYGVGNFTLEGMTVGNTYYLRMWDYGNNDSGTVDFCLEELPCNVPTGLSAANETTSGADLSWTESGAANHWDLYIVTAGSPAPDAGTTPTVDNTTNNPYTWTGGAASTDYDWYVRADCGASGGSGQSDWSAKGTFTTASADAVDWCNLQFPDAATITAGGSVDVYAQVYEPGVTDAAGQGAGITAWIGYSTTDTDPSTWTDWVAATYNVDDGNNDEYQAALGAGLAPGTYYYASRFKLNSGAYQYGGYSAGGGGFWDGTNYVSGVLTVNHIDGDLCTSAIALTVNDVCTNTTGSNTGATDSGESPAPGCGSYNGADVWFSFVVPATGHVIINTVAGDITDGAMAAYSGTCGSLTLIECNDDGGPGTMPMLDLSGLTAGETIYIRFWEYGGNTFGTFDICVQKGCPTNLTVLPADASSTTSTASCIDGDWTTYYNGTNILLSLKLGGTGAVVPDNAVTIDPHGAAPDAFWVASQNGNFVHNVEGGAAFMYRKWEVAPTTEPTSPVAVRFYYTGTEYDAVNTEISNQGGTQLTGHEQMNFFKVLNGSDPFDVGALAEADGQEITNGATATDSTWIHGTFDTEHYAEFLVAGFSGGGGGGASAGAPFPVELVAFTGHAKDAVNMLNWTTASEQNSKYYAIERSTDGKDFAEIGKVNAAGNSVHTSNYSFIDKTPVPVAYYRLRTVDTDGKTAVSNMITIKRSDEAGIISVYPVPAKHAITLNFNQVTRNEVTVSITDIAGKVVRIMHFNAEKGTNTRNIDIHNFAAGTYFLHLNDGVNVFTERVVKN